MKLLVLNSGGSSVKYKLYDMSDESVLLAGGVERLNEPSGLVKHKWGAGQVHEEEMPSPSHQKAIDRALRLVVDPQRPFLKSKPSAIASCTRASVTLARSSSPPT